MIYLLMGKGFGDDENQWEVCGAYASRAGAEAAMDAQLVDDIDPDWLRIDELELGD